MAASSHAPSNALASAASATNKALSGWSKRSPEAADCAPRLQAALRARRCDAPFSSLLSSDPAQ
eukprot:4917402-Alexandrium_andersonii.AAC.1